MKEKGLQKRERPAKEGTACKRGKLRGEGDASKDRECRVAKKGSAELRETTWKESRGSAFEGQNVNWSIEKVISETAKRRRHLVQ